MLKIYTRTPKVFSKERLKYCLSFFLNKRRGPEAVLQSLHRGLTALSIPHSINPLFNSASKNDTVHIISGIEALRWAIAKAKKAGISKLIAGPNLVVTPLEYEGIIRDTSIDIILQPSQWVVDFYISIAPEIKEKTKVWPAGVEISSVQKYKNEKPHCLIYKKFVSQDTYENVYNGLKSQGISSSTLTYGEFKPNEFYSELIKADFMIYLSTSESQGLALQEAWIRNVPTLVLNDKIWSYGSYTWTDDKIAAPYLNDQCGVFFSSNDDIQSTLQMFQKQLETFNPREYVLSASLDDKSSALMYLRAIGYN